MSPQSTETDTPAARLRRLFSSDGKAAVVLGSLLAFLVVTYIVVLWALQPDAPGRELALDEVKQGVREGTISEVTLLAVDERFVGADDEGEWWTATGGNAFLTSDLLSSFSDAGVRTIVADQVFKDLLGRTTDWVLPTATLIVGFAFLFVLVAGRSGQSYALLGRAGARRYGDGTEGRVTFADIAGLQEAIEDLQEVRDFLVAPERFEAMGARPPRGVLMSGPPGCGKTLLARAVAGEAGVPFYSISGSEFGGFLVGVGPSRVRDLFKQAKQTAPSIVFIDELDAVGRARSSGETLNTEGESTLNELLVQLDGFDSTDRVVLMAATNRPDILDRALVRKGRFDRQIVIDLPDQAARAAIARVHARGKPLARDVELDAFVRRTAGLSGADIAATFNEAAMLAARRRLSAIGMAELREAVERVVAGAERSSRVLSDEDKWRVAYHEAGHALIAWTTSTTRSVEKVTIVSRGHSLGSTWDVAIDDRRTRRRSEMQEELTYRLAGRAAEFVVFGEPAGGSGDDLRRATRLAREMVCDLGMSDGLGPLFTGRNGDRSGHSEEVAAQVDREVRLLLAEADARARDALESTREHLDLLAELLVEHETLERDELNTVLAELPQATAIEPAPEPA